ncbi:MAG TPA: C40 family peptidase [Verrucomicrobiae bacterium]|jgi:cell wall-associated NlpC family hydrolase|nr:C40 family peptidase [Verrucomicrobiae bacterium]
MQTDPSSQPVLAAVQSVKAKFAPDPHLAIFNVTVARKGDEVVLKGDVENAAAKTAVLAAVAATGVNAVDEVQVLPNPDLGDRTWGIATVSVVNVREKPGHASEMGTQILMGNVFRVWDQTTNWFLVQSADGYPGWSEGGGFLVCTREEADAWNASPLLIVTAFEERILEERDADSLPVADVVMGCLVKYVGQTADWLKVQLADGRVGYMPKKSAVDYAEWRASRHATPDNIERTAKSFLGRPYFWGCNSIRGMDCSGLTKLVFFLNGVDLHRNSAQQMADGADVPIDSDFKNLKKGDLLFFGRRARGGMPEKITHVGIYLGDKLFIQSAGSVRISSLDPDSPLRDPKRTRSLLHARRVLRSTTSS